MKAHSESAAVVCDDVAAAAADAEIEAEPAVAVGRARFAKMRGPAAAQ
jgi:formylmethanofuran dehydrogenase subunit B